MGWLETGILWMMVFPKASGQGDAAAVPRDAGQGLGAPPRAWQGQAGGLLRASRDYLFLDLACRVQSILQLVKYDLKVTYDPGRGLGASGSPEGFEGVQGSLTLLTFTHDMLDPRYPV